MRGYLLKFVFHFSYLILSPSSLTFSLPLSLSALTSHRVPYLAIARTFEKIEEETKRLKIIATLTNLFRSVILLSPNELLQCVYLCLNKVCTCTCTCRVLTV